MSATNLKWGCCMCSSVGNLAFSEEHSDGLQFSRIAPVIACVPDSSQRYPKSSGMNTSLRISSLSNSRDTCQAPVTPDYLGILLCFTLSDPCYPIDEQGSDLCSLFDSVQDSSPTPRLIAFTIPLITLTAVSTCLRNLMCCCT